MYKSWEIQSLTSPIELKKTGLIGSCFAEEMGQWMYLRKNNVWFNPFTTLYNPVSLLNHYSYLLGDTYNAPSLFHLEDTWGDFQFNTKSQLGSEQAVQEYTTSCRNTFQSFFENTETVVITLGTAWVFTHQNKVVANCHRLPSTHFERKKLTVAECVDALQGLVTLFKSKGVKRFVFTLSPIRHSKDGLEGNSLSKATLRLAIDELVRDDFCHYFPASEILLDELRDHRFYQEDLMHPSQQAVDFILGKFIDWAFSEESIDKLKKKNKEFYNSLHRPLNQEEKRWSD